MTILPTLAVLTEMSLALIAFGGFFVGQGAILPGVAMAAVGIGWNAILYMTLFRKLGEKA